MIKRNLNTFIKNISKLSFGDYILFQEYKPKWIESEKQHHYHMATPLMAVYIGWFCCDQTVGMEYVLWQNDKKESSGKVEVHIEWNDYIDIIGYWKNKPNWKEIRKAYKNHNSMHVISSEEIEWNNL